MREGGTCTMAGAENNRMQLLKENNEVVRNHCQSVNIQSVGCRDGCERCMSRAL